MAQTFTGRKRVRKFFGHIREVARNAQPDRSAEGFLRSIPDGGRAQGRPPDEGLQSVFKSVFPISDFSSTALLEFVKYEFEAAEIRRRRMPPARHDLRRAAQGDAAPDRVRRRSRDTGAKSVKDIKEQDVYMGDMPFMTDERHLHRQRHRARHRLADAPLARACSSITTRARAIRPASCCSPPASFPIAAPGSTSSSTPRTSSMRASTVAGKFR